MPNNNKRKRKEVSGRKCRFPALKLVNLEMARLGWDLGHRRDTGRLRGKGDGRATKRLDVGRE